MQVDVAALKELIRTDGRACLQPICVVGVAGRTTTGAIDDLNALARVCTAAELWFHVDGAFGARTAIAPAHRCLVARTESAGSLGFDLHKWMYLPYPIGCVLVRKAEAHHHAFSLTPTYLAHGKGDRGPTAAGVPWLFDLGFEFSRAFQALKAWTTIEERRALKYGRLVEQNLEQAHQLAALVDAAPKLELALPVSWNVVCFRYVRPGLDDAAANRPLPA